MCLARAYLDSESNEPILADIARATFEDEKVEFETLFGEKKTVLGKVKVIDFTDSIIIVKSKE